MRRGDLNFFFSAAGGAGRSAGRAAVAAAGRSCGSNGLLHYADFTGGQIIKSVHEKFVLLQPETNNFVGRGEGAECTRAALIADIQQGVIEHFLAEALLLKFGENGHHADLKALILVAHLFNHKGSHSFTAAYALENAGVSKALILETLHRRGDVGIGGKAELLAYGIVGFDDNTGTGLDIAILDFKNHKISHVRSVLFLGIQAPKAEAFGALFCVVAQIFKDLIMYKGVSEEDASTYTTIFMIFFTVSTVSGSI